MKSIVKAGTASILLLSGIILYAQLPGPADISSLFEARMHKSARLGTLPYRLMKPAGYDKTKKYPLVLFLHGAGERGTDNKKQLLIGLNIFADPKRIDRYPCFIAAPQCPDNDKWVDVEWKAERHVMKESPTQSLAMALEIIAGLQKEFSIDPDRLYVIGYSMGGFGTWDAIQRYPSLFAAAVPVCGGGDETAAGRIVHVPVWAFHGALDTVVKANRSRNMINAIVKAGGIPRFTEYPAINHFCWGKAFSDGEMLEWLFKQTNSNSGRKIHPK
jgi:predicted peptidase